MNCCTVQYSTVLPPSDKWCLRLTNVPFVADKTAGERLLGINKSWPSPTNLTYRIWCACQLRWARDVGFHPSEVLLYPPVRALDSSSGERASRRSDWVSQSVNVRQTMGWDWNKRPTTTATATATITTTEAHHSQSTVVEDLVEEAKERNVLLPSLRYSRGLCSTEGVLFPNAG